MGKPCELAMNPYTIGSTVDSTSLYSLKVIHLMQARTFFTAIKTRPLLPSETLDLEAWRGIMRSKEFEFNILSKLLDEYMSLAGKGNPYTKEEITKLVLATPFNSSLTVVFPGVVHINKLDSFAAHAACLGILLISLGPTNLFAGHMSFKKHGLRFLQNSYKSELAKFIFDWEAPEFSRGSRPTRPIGISVNISPKQLGMNRILRKAGFHIMNEIDDTIEYFLLANSAVDLQEMIMAGMLSKHPSPIEVATQRQLSLFGPESLSKDFPQGQDLDKKVDVP